MICFLVLHSISTIVLSFVIVNDVEGGWWVERQSGRRRNERINQFSVLELLTVTFPLIFAVMYVELCRGVVYMQTDDK